MYHKNVFAVCAYLLCFHFSMAQNEGITAVLQEIEQNNKELQALASLVDSRKLELKSGNNLPDPQLGAYYLPWGEHSTGDYTEYEISQSFEFPTVYGARGNLIDQQSVQVELEYQAKRQKILSNAKAYCLELIYLNKRLIIEQQRVEHARTVFEQVRELFEKEQVGILEMNKAKVAWMQEQFKVRQIESDRQNLLLLLQNLNGGNAVTLQLSEYTAALGLDEKDSLWQEKLSKDPQLKQIRQEETIAIQRLKLAKSKSLPNLTAGFNYQGVSSSNYSGIYAGISIPLWSSHNKVKAAQSHLEFQETYSDSRTLEAYAGFEKQYNDYQITLARFREYQSTLSGLNSDELLLKAYQLGEISFLEYHMELQFYRQAYDAMLEMQLQLYQSQNELLKHEL